MYKRYTGFWTRCLDDIYQILEFHNGGISFNIGLINTKFENVANLNGLNGHSAPKSFCPRLLSPLFSSQQVRFKM